MQQQVMWYAWVASLAVEALLLAILRGRPVFRLFLLVDVLRTIPLIILAATVVPTPFDAYVRAWQWTELPVMALLCATAIEAAADVYAIRLVWQVYVFAVAVATIAGQITFILLPAHSESLGSYFWGRCLGDFGALSGIILAMANAQRWPAHQFVLAVFIGVDLTGYLTQALYHTPGHLVAAFLMVGQCGCLIAWLVIRLRRGQTNPHLALAFPEKD